MLADDLFLIALDDRTGRFRLPPRTLGLGLAAALLGELMLAGRITIVDSVLRVVDRQPPGDALAHTTLDHLVGERDQHPVRVWLQFLSAHACEDVADRLWRAGVVRRQQTRRRWHRETIYPPVDANVAHGPTARMVAVLDRRQPATWDDAALTGLVYATGLHTHVLWTAGPEARETLRHLVEQLTPALYELTWYLHAAVGDAVLTGRT